MTIIHMDTEQVRGISQRLRQASTNIEDKILATQNAVKSINWQGQSRDEFFFELEQVVKSILDLAEDVACLGTRVEKEVEEWELTDRNRSAGISAERYRFSANRIDAQVLGLSALPATGGTVAVIYPTYKLQAGPSGNRFYENEDYLGVDKIDTLIRDTQNEILANQTDLEEINKRLGELNTIKHQNQVLLDEIETELTPPKKNGSTISWDYLLVMRKQGLKCCKTKLGSMR